MNKRRRWKAKRRRAVGLRQHRQWYADSWTEWRMAIRWLREHGE